MRDLADSLFSHSAQRRERATQLRLAQTKQKVGLIFSWIDAFAKHRVAVAGIDDPGRAKLDKCICTAGVTDPGYNGGDKRVMAGRGIIAAQRLCVAPSTR